MRKCRNWQTSKTKDLVTVYVVWVQVPSSARTKRNRFDEPVPFLFVRKGTLTQQLRCVGSGIHTRLEKTSSSVHPWLALSSCCAWGLHLLSALLKVPLASRVVKRFNSECKSKICFLLIIVIHFYVDECALYVCEWYAYIFWWSMHDDILYKEALGDSLFLLFSWRSPNYFNDFWDLLLSE